MSPSTYYSDDSQGVFEHFRLLVSPPRDRDVLIADEKVFYKAPKHLMSLAEPALETFAVLVVVTTILALGPGRVSLGQGTRVGMVGAHVGRDRLVCDRDQQHRPHRSRGWSRPALHRPLWSANLALVALRDSVPDQSSNR